MIEVKDVHKSFNDNEVIKGVSLSLNEGEVVTILGPSGSGKTTFLRCLNFLETADSGSITVNDEQVTFGQANANDILQLRRDRKSTRLNSSH